MSKRLRRRAFLHGTAASLPLLAHAAHAKAATPRPDGLIADPKGLLDLPEGFTYRILSRTGDPMSDGYRTPGRPDAMGVFAAVGGKLVLMRNHELMPGDALNAPYMPGQTPPPEAYDPASIGGVSRLVLDANTLQVVHSNLVLVGTDINCAGGLSPWGWLTCEETFAPNHGHVFLCPTGAATVAAARVIKPYGRFRHEAATVDPETHVGFLTEDMEDAAFYRFVPKHMQSPFEGKLQALAVKGSPRFDTGSMTPGQTLACEWVDVDEPDPQEDTVRLQAQARGAALFHRTEGLWLDGSSLYLTATTGGPIGRGQVFRLHHRGPRDGQLELVAHAADTNTLDMPDNLTVSPLGHVYMCEDGPEGNFLRRLTLDGRVVPFARNRQSESEFAGICFSPDGKTAFVNLQTDGLTLAIQGPFERELQRDAPLVPHVDEQASTPPGLLGIGAGLSLIAVTALVRRRRQPST